MRFLKSLAGYAALIGLVGGLNLLVFRQNPFALSVLFTFGAGILAGLVWIGLTILLVVRRSAKEGRALYGLNTVLMSTLFLGICIVLYAFAAHLNKSWDLTQEGRRELAPQTMQVLQNLDKDVNVIAFFLKVDDELVSIAREKTERFLDQCSLYTSHLKIEFLDPQLDAARLDGLNVSHYSTQGTVVLRCGSRQKVITLAGVNPRLEERDFTNSLINVVRDAQPKVCFLTGHGERNIADADPKNGGSKVKSLLEGESYAVEAISIKLVSPEVPPDCDVLVIDGLGLQGPQSDLHPDEIRAIQAFLDRGGRLMVLLDPWRRVATTENQMEQLLPWLEKRYGIVLPNHIVLAPRNERPWVVEFSGDPTLFQDQGTKTDFMGCFNSAHRITQNFDQKMAFSAARPVYLVDKMPNQVAGVPLLRSTPEFYAETDVAGLMSTGKAAKASDEKPGPLTMAVAVTAKTNFQVGDSGQTRDARIVVVGDSEFSANGQVSVIPGNFNFFMNAIAWLTESEDLIAIRSTGKQEMPLMLSALDKKVVAYIALLGPLQLVIVAGLFVFLHRRKFQ